MKLINQFVMTAQEAAKTEEPYDANLPMLEYQNVYEEIIKIGK